MLQDVLWCVRVWWVENVSSTLIINSSGNEGALITICLVALQPYKLSCSHWTGHWQLSCCHTAIWSTPLANHKHDAQKTWSLINNIMNRTKKNADQPNTIAANDILLNDPLQIANAFNSYFVNVGPNLTSKIKIPKNSNHKVYLKEKYTNAFEFTKVDELEVNSIIDNLSPKPSYGFDGCPQLYWNNANKQLWNLCK